VVVSNVDLRQDGWAGILQAMLPPGRWRLDAGGNLSGVLRAIATGFASLHGRILALLDREADPAQTLELLPEWEREFGLPDECAPSNPTLAQRRAALSARIADQGGQDIAHMVAVAASLGFAITITRYQPLRAGFSAGSAAYGPTWAYAWLVHAEAQTVRRWTAGSLAGEALSVWGNSELECRLNRIKPAHSILLFSYGG
jgi:uncharacterized protein YmfQ (DUF2313 family)